jgi:putative flippase GtrA
LNPSPAPSPLANLLAKHHIKVKFVLVGAWNTVFGYLVFLVLDTLFAGAFSRRYVAYMTAMVLSNLLAITNAYIFHKYVTFKSDVRGRAVIAEFLRFFTTYVFTFCMSLALLPIFVEILNIGPKMAAALVIFVCTVVSWVGHSRFSFNPSATIDPK